MKGSNQTLKQRINKNLRIGDISALTNFRQTLQNDFSNKALGNSGQQKKPQNLNSSSKLIFQNFQDLSSMNNQILERIKKLQGQCKIQEWEFLQFNLFKSIIVIFLLIITVFGLFALKYSAWFRKITMFQVVTSFNSATHIFIKGNNNQCVIQKILLPSTRLIFFYYKKLKYFISKSSKPIPVGYLFQNQFKDCFDPRRFQVGLNQPEIQAKKQLYGLNEHQVQVPTYPEYLIDVLTQPFFLLQYFFCFVFFMQGYTPFSIALLFFSFVTTTINYIMLYISYRKIKEIAQKDIQVLAIRNGEQTKINCRQLVPGDVIIPQQGQQVPADCIVGFGDIYVNEANLTGQSIPIGKFKLQSYQDIHKTNVWIFQGSKVLQTKIGKNYAIVINTGFKTLRGQIIRKILNRTVKDPDILRSTLIFVLQVVLVSLIVYFSTLIILLESDIERLFVFFKLIDFLASSAPPTLPIFFNLAYSLSLLRLRMRGIQGTQPQKVVEGAQLKTFCFDKTGTLTQSDVKIRKILKLQEKQNNFKQIMKELKNQQNRIIWGLFATCHTVKLISGQLLGDQIDKEMFEFAEAEMQSSLDPNIRLVIKNKIKITEGENIVRRKNLQILRINQFQSKFQSMSVLVRDTLSNQLFIFVKGSPQMLVQNCPSINKVQKRQRAYSRKIKSLSINGYRTIAMGYKIVEKEQLSLYLKAQRTQFVKNIKVLGLICFQNSLKHDSKNMIQKLKSSNIRPKMITGDNINIAVETARRAGILSPSDKVVFLQGKNNQLQYSEAQNENLSHTSTQKRGRCFKGTIMTQFLNNQGQVEQFTQKQINIQEKVQYTQGEYVYAIDNSFLSMKPSIFLSDKVCIFARIPPQNKALIIKKYKQQHRNFISTNYSRFVRFLKIKNEKIGMCGDGANDLIALRQADVSIGLHTKDASYGSSFTIKKMSDVSQIIHQSKGTLANIINLYQYYASISFCFLICSMILAKQATFISTAQLMLINFCGVLLTPVLITLSHPTEIETHYVPENNMMGLHNHLVFWGNSIIPFIGVLISWLYFSQTSQFKPNPIPKATIESGFNSKNHTTTLIYILQFMITSINGFIIYQSKPWREPIYRNYFLMILLMSNLSIAIIFAFLNDKISLFEFEAISYKNIGISLAITVVALLINFSYNGIVKSLKLNYKVMHEKRVNQ